MQACSHEAVFFVLNTSLDGHFVILEKAFYFEHPTPNTTYESALLILLKFIRSAADMESILDQLTFLK